MANEGESEETTYKILVLGDSNVGKTCLIHRYCDKAFYEHYISTIGIDCRQKVVNVKGQPVRLRIWDTAGQERFRTLTTAYYRGAQGIVMVYDITSEETFQHLSYWMKNISTMASKHICKLLVGNKCDLDADRRIKTENAQKLASTFDIEYIETSCKENTNVDKVFDVLANQISQVQEKVIEERRISLNQRMSSAKPSSPKSSSSCPC